MPCSLPGPHDGNIPAVTIVLPTMTIRATWKGAVLAESDQTVVVEGNHYFPEADVHAEYFEPSQAHTTCPWKGEGPPSVGGGGRPAQRRRRVVLPRTQGCSQGDHRPRRLLEGRRGRRSHLSSLVGDRQLLRRRAMSKQAMAPAVATLRDDRLPCWGIEARASHRFRVRAANPVPSDPSTKATGSLPRGSS